MNQSGENQERRPGIYSDISNTDYHADKDSYSSSIIKKMDVPALAKHALDSPSEYKDCFRIGSAIHGFILEPDRFASEFLTGINCARRSNDDKATWADWYAENGWADADTEILGKKIPAASWNPAFEAATGKRMVTPAELVEIELMAQSVQRNDNARDLLEKGKAEQSIYWTDKETGLSLRCRPDFFNGFCSDLKSCQSVDNFTIDRAIANLGYDVQAAMYADGCQQVTGEHHPFLFIFIQKTAPYLCRVISLSDESSDIGWNKYQERKQLLADCLDSGEWPGIEDDLSHSLFAKAA